MTENHGADGSAQAQAPLIINGQYIKDLSFETPNAPGIFQEMKSPPQVTVGIDVAVNQLGGPTYEVVLSFRIEGKLQERTAFILELAYAGIATVHVPEEHMQAVLLIEVPRMVFPFARAIISDITRDSGFPPLLLGPIDFVALFRQRMEAQQQTATA